MDQRRVDNNGSGETVSIYASDLLLSDIYDEQIALRIVAEHNAEASRKQQDRCWCKDIAPGSAWATVCEKLADSRDAAQEREGRLVASIRTALDELIGRDEISAVDTLRAALAEQPAPGTTTTGG